MRSSKFLTCTCDQSSPTQGSVGSCWGPLHRHWVIVSIGFIKWDDTYVGFGGLVTPVGAATAAMIFYRGYRAQGSQPKRS